ncbi:MAG: hypothetical protein ACUVRX_11185 [Actinomycetota bacterium]
MWKKIRTTNVLERAFREVRRLSPYRSVNTCHSKIRLSDNPSLRIDFPIVFKWVCPGRKGVVVRV